MQFQIEPLREAFPTNITKERSITRMLFDMHSQSGSIGEFAFTVIANVFQQSRITLLLLMYLHVFEQTVLCVASLIADLTDEWFLSGMFQQVLVEKGFMYESLLADLAFMRLLLIGNVRPHVVVEVVLLCEATRTQLALERAVFDVCTKMLTE